MTIENVSGGILIPEALLQALKLMYRKQNAGSWYSLGHCLYDEPWSWQTAIFEALAISWLEVASTNAVSDRMKIIWDEAWGIIERALRCGIERRPAEAIQELVIDETSFQKHHEYVTILVNRAQAFLIDILDDRKKISYFYSISDKTDSRGFNSYLSFYISLKYSW